MRRLWLIPHAPTAATRSGAFPADESLDERGRTEAGELSLPTPARFDLLTSPAPSCRETADAAGLGTPEIEPALGDCDFGSWAGWTLGEISAEEANGFTTWMSDPEARPHGGETLAELATRVGAWLDAEAKLDGGAVAITHAAVVRAAVVCALQAPLESFWQVDAAPLSITELHVRSGRWRLTRVNAT